MAENVLSVEETERWFPVSGWVSCLDTMPFQLFLSLSLPPQPLPPLLLLFIFLFPPPGNGWSSSLP